MGVFICFFFTRQLCNLASLERLDLHENRLFADLPERMNQLGALQQLRLHGNARVGGALPLELLEIGRLEVLSLHFESALAAPLDDA